MRVLDVWSDDERVEGGDDGGKDETTLEGMTVGEGSARASDLHPFVE